MHLPCSILLKPINYYLLPMSTHLKLVALANTAIPAELNVAFAEHAKVLGLEIARLEIQPTHSKYYVTRWTTSQVLMPEARIAMRDIAATYNADLAFLSPGFKSDEVKVLAMDMDSTLINIECIDEIADFTGMKASVSEITEATMRGEIKDFKESLRPIAIGTVAHRGLRIHIMSGRHRKQVAHLHRREVFVHLGGLILREERFEVMSYCIFQCLIRSIYCSIRQSARLMAKVGIVIRVDGFNDGASKTR